MRPLSNTLVLGLLTLGAACARPSTTPSGDAKDAPASACPDAVRQSIAREFPGATIATCKAEREDNRDQIEVKLTDQGGEKIEVDVAPEGAILQVEQSVALDRVPAKVMTAFAAKYPGAKAKRAEKQTRTGKGTAYELAFTGDAKLKEATFADDGTFLEEE